MSQGSAPRQADLFRDTSSFVEPLVRPDSIHALLARECHALFPDELFGDLFAAGVGRRSVPPLVVAVVMVLQRLEGLSDREAVERFTFDARWKYAAGGLPFDHPGFAHTVLVDMRARLARSDRPNRIFERTLEVARSAGLVGVRRVLDSTPLYDAVATMDTVTLVRSAIRGVLGAAGDREPRLRAGLRRDDDYRSGGKPAADWDDAEARAALVDALARDGEAVLTALEDEPLPPTLAEAAALLATVLGQDLEPGPDGRIRIARRVAPDRVIGTVDPDTRHGHKTDARSFDGYKAHVAIDPDHELVTATAVTPGNAGDASVVLELLETELAEATPAERPVVYGDAAYGTGPVLAAFETHGVIGRVKVQPPSGVAGRFTKDDFAIDLAARTVTCPAGRTVPILGRVEAYAEFGRACLACPLVDRCTTRPRGRTIQINPHEALLAAGRAATRDPVWRADYRATRPKVERKLAHLVRRRHGGRRARVRGRLKVDADFTLLAAAVNLARLAVLGLAGSGGTWALQPA
ncbi:MAG: IS1182 family transposase [Actinomycetota bacterium]